MEVQKKWFVYMEDHHEGPFTPEEIYQRQKAGNVNPESYVWCEGMADWQMLEQVAELKTALQQFKEPEPAPSPAPKPASPPKSAIGISPATQAQYPTLDNGEAPTSAAPKERSKKTSPIALLFVACVAIMVIGLGALAVVSRTASEDTHSALRPTFIKILDRAPMLGSLIKLTPKIQDVKPEDLSELEQAMIGTPQNGVKIGLALSITDPNRPFFYIATNLPDKTKLDLILVGNGETLLNRLSFSTITSVVTKFGLGKTETILAIGGQPIPKGEYQVYVVEANEQDETIRPILNDLQSSRVQTKTPSEVPTGTKFLFTKTVFIGGERDETYLTRLKAFHEKVKQSAERELQELKQYSDTLQLQYGTITSDFNKLYRSKKITPQLKTLWLKTTTTWQQINGQLDQTIQTWTKETLQNEFFYGKTYELVKNAYETLKNLVSLESSFINQPQDKPAFEIQHGKALSESRDALELLKTKVDQILKSPKTANGLPTREE